MLAITENLIYTLALTAGFTATLTYGVILLFTVGLKSQEYNGYNIARKIFGTTLLVWTVHIVAHLLLNVRYTNDYLATIISLSSYYILVTGFEMVFHSLLDSNFFSGKKAYKAIASCSIYSIILAVGYLYAPISIERQTTLALTTPLIVKIIQAAYRATKRYHDVKRNIDNYYSDDTSESVEWMRNSLYIMLALGFACLVIPYGSAISDAFTMVIAVSAMTYVMISLRNYVVSISSIQKQLDTIVSATSEPETKIPGIKIKMLEKSLDEWIKTNRFVEPGITIDDLAADIQSNRRYISSYLNHHLNLTFKSWIALLKIEYSKNLLIKHPDYTTNTVAEMVGYSRSNFNKAFVKLEGKAPNTWRQENMA